MKRFVAFKHPLLLLVLLLAGCQHGYGVVMVNHTSATLHDVWIHSGPKGPEMFDVTASILLRDGYMRSDFVQGSLRGRSRAQWTREGDIPQLQELQTDVPTDFGGYLGFEFTDTGVRFSLLQRDAVSAFIAPRHP